MMSDECWYASQDDRQSGPLTLETLEQMVRSQQLVEDDLVWQVGTPGWVPAGQVPALCAAAGWGHPRAPSLPPVPRESFEDQVRPHLRELRHRVGDLDKTASALEALPHLRLVHHLLEELGRRVTVDQLDLADRVMKRIGSLAYMLAALLYAVFFAITSLRADSIQQFLTTLLIVLPGAAICHFVAIHFIEASENMLRQTPTELSSKTLAMSVGLLSGTGGLVMLVSASHDLFRSVDIVGALGILVIGLLLLYTASACLNPASLNLTVEARARAEREAIGISMFLAKVPLRLIPVTFGFFSLLAAGSAIFFCYRLATGEEVDRWFVQALGTAPEALMVGFLPMALYLVSVFSVLWMGCLRALLDASDGVRDLADSLKRD